MISAGGVARIVALMALPGALAIAQHGGGGHGGIGGGGGHGAGFSGGHTGGHIAAPGGFHVSGNFGSRGGNSFSPGGGAFPAGSRTSSVGPFAAYSGTVGRYGHNYSYGPWRARSRYGRYAYGLPYGYLAPYYFSYLGTPFYGDYDNFGYPADTGSYDVNSQPPPYSPASTPPYYPQFAPPQPAQQLEPPEQTSPVVSEPAVPVPPITVVLNDGQTLQVQNYAVVGNIFWNFSSRPVHKIPLSAINVPASVKASEAAGAEFPDINTAH